MPEAAALRRILVRVDQMRAEMEDVRRELADMVAEDDLEDADAFAEHNLSVQSASERWCVPPDTLRNICATD